MGQNLLAENESHIYPNMCAKFGCGPTVVSKKGRGGGTDRQTKISAALYSRYSSVCVVYRRYYVAPSRISHI